MFGRVQLKIFDLMVPIVRRLDRFLPWPGLGLIAVARHPDAPREGRPSVAGAAPS